MGKGAAEFRAALDAARPGVILEGEGALPVENIHDHHASWAQWFNDGDVPGVLRNKWLERRHIQHQIKRWEYDHTGELHAAWMNGSGMMVWENVFGSWVPWSPRDRSILRAMLPIQRRYGGLFTGENWTPLAPTGQTGLFAGLWEGPGLRLWTLVNRRNEPVSGVLFEIGTQAGERVYDLIKGEELRTEAGESRPRIEGVIPARGIGCILAAKPDQLGHDFGGFVKRQRETSARADFDAATPVRETRLVDAAPTDRATQVPEGMVEIPPVTLELAIEMRQRECGYYESAPPGGHRLADSYRFNTVTFRRRVEFKRFAIDAAPVTNAEFAEFLNATKWKPNRPENFLKHWAAGRPPAGQEDHPVVYVDLDDARACAGWKGKRLPTEEEWQYAAQGADGRVYPWGNEMQPGRCNDGTSGGTMPVRAFSLGRSPFGCYDLCGNVWHWTESERTDGRTRFCIIRGGACFSARGSNWYVDGGPRPANFATKFLLMWPGLDRCGTIGFRCVKDLD
jgi:formylglycine-generating enzyme required for sulfatase activity